MYLKFYFNFHTILLVQKQVTINFFERYVNLVQASSHVMLRTPGSNWTPNLMNRTVLGNLLWCWHGLWHQRCLEACVKSGSPQVEVSLPGVPLRSLRTNPWGSTKSRAFYSSWADSFVGKVFTRRWSKFHFVIGRRKKDKPAVAVISVQDVRPNDLGPNPALANGLKRNYETKQK